VTVRIRVESAASEELQAAAAWYEEKRPRLGSELLEEVERTLELIRRHPRAGTPVPRVRTERGTRRVPLDRFPYSVVYRERPTEIQVVAFAHHSRKPGYWRAR
jgi:toxin ParE1/3/4